jgi:hypothetical protein
MLAVAGIASYLQGLPSSKISVRSVTTNSDGSPRAAACSRVPVERWEFGTGGNALRPESLRGAREAETPETELIQKTNANISRAISSPPGGFWAKPPIAQQTTYRSIGRAVGVLSPLAPITFTNGATACEEWHGPSANGIVQLATQTVQSK